MFDSETGGTAKGSLKDRLRFLNILIRISKKNKWKLSFDDINTKRLSNTNRFFLFFYNPIKVTLDNNLKTNNTILYNGAVDSSNMALIKNSNSISVNVEIISKHKKKKGIDGTSINSEENTLSSKTKEEIINEYHVDKSQISESLVNDYLAIKNNSKELFDTELSEDIKKALIINRIKAEADVNKLKRIAELEKDIILGRDIEYDLKQDNKSFEKLNKLLEKQKAEIEQISREIDKYSVITEIKYNFTNFNSLLSMTIGLGVGLLTLPFSYSRSFTLGTNLIRKALHKASAFFNTKDTKAQSINYRIDIKDIETAAKSLKSSEFLLEDILDKLDHLKYKIKMYEYKIPDASKKLKEIEALESGLSKKKRELSKIVESFEKSKVKVIERSGKKN